MLFCTALTLTYLPYNIIYALLRCNQCAGAAVEPIPDAINHHNAFRHCAGDGVKVEAVHALGIPAFDHVAVCIIAHPLATIGFLVNIFAHGFFAVVHRIQPIPGVAVKIINFLAAALGPLANTALVPVVAHFGMQPLTVQHGSP